MGGGYTLCRVIVENADAYISKLNMVWTFINVDQMGVFRAN